MEQFTADLAQLDSLQFAARDTNELLLDVASKWQQISPESLQPALGMFGTDFLSAYSQAQSTYVRATTQLATVAGTIDNVTGRAIEAFSSVDNAASTALESR